MEMSVNMSDPWNQFTKLSLNIYWQFRKLLKFTDIVIKMSVNMLYTVKTGLFSISLPQTVPLPIMDLLNTYLGNTVFVYWPKFVCVITVHKHHFSVSEHKLCWLNILECYFRNIMRRMLDRLDPVGVGDSYFICSNGQGGRAGEKKCRMSYVWIPPKYTF